ncbi:MAG: hypothetical protein AB7S75_04875 [Desulfococcaceae bacterium]
MKKRYLGCLMVLVFFGASCAGAADLAGVEIHGFISQGLLWSDNNSYFSEDTEDTSFQFNELGINFGKNLTDQLRVGMQFFSRDLGRTGNNEVVIDWAYGDYRWRDWLGIRAGLMKMPHGLYNETRDQDMIRTAILLPQSVYPEMERDYYTRMWGAEIYGNVFAEAIGNLSYKFLAGTYNPDPDNSGLAVRVAARGSMEVQDFNHGIQYSAGLIWETPLDGLRLSATGWIMNDAGADVKMASDFAPNVPAGSVTSLEIKRWASVYSIEYVWENLRMTAEYRREHTESKWPDLARPKSKVDAEGYYIGAGYRFTDWLEAGTYYSVFYPDMDDRGGDSYAAQGNDFQAWQKDLALSLRFDINEYWLLKLEGHVMDGAATLLSSDNPDGYEEDDFLFAAKVTFNF